MLLHKYENLQKLYKLSLNESTNKKEIKSTKKPKDINIYMGLTELFIEPK